MGRNTVWNTFIYTWHYIYTNLLYMSLTECKSGTIQKLLIWS